MAELSAAPWTHPWAAVDYLRVVLVANSAVAWSRTICEEYADLYGIPRANIVDVNTGTTPNVWTPTDTAQFLANFITPIANAIDAVGSGLVILGPFVQARVELWELTGVFGTWAVSGSSRGYPCLWLAAGYARALRDGVTGTLCADLDVFGNSQLTEWRSTTSVVSRIPPNLSTMLGSFDWVEYTLPGFTGLPLIRVPTQAATLRVQTAGAVYNPTARLGWDSWQGPMAAETEAGVRAILTATRAALTANSQTDSRTRKILMHMRAVTGTTLNQWASWTAYMQGLGLNVDYLYHTSDTSLLSAPWTTTVPVAGAVKTYAQLVAGLSPALGYYCQLGNTDNGEFWLGPPTVWETNQAPLTGGSSFVCSPSEGYRYNVQAVSVQGATAGMTDCYHRTSGTVQEDISTWHALLRGMPPILACYWKDFAGIGAGLAMGDPLYAPFGGTIASTRQPIRNATRRIR